MPCGKQSWEWLVTPHKTGSFTLQVHLTVLQGGTGSALLPDQTVDIPIQVNQTSENTLASIWNGIKEFSLVLGASGVSLGAIIVFVVRRIRRRREPAAAGAATGPTGGPRHSA